MHHSLLLYQSPEDFAARKNPAHQAAFWASFGPYLQAMKDAGIFVSGAGLEPPATATSIRLKDGQRRLVQDGPFADTKEQLGGFIIIEVPDHKTALDWAARYPAGIGGGIEVRPNVPAHT
jgi:hypothetical protein